MNASVIGFLTFLVPFHKNLPPLMSLSGHSPIHELNAAALLNFERSGPDLGNYGLDV